MNAFTEAEISYLKSQHFGNTGDSGRRRPASRGSSWLSLQR